MPPPQSVVGTQGNQLGNGAKSLSWGWPAGLKSLGVLYLGIDYKALVPGAWWMVSGEINGGFN